MEQGRCATDRAAELSKSALELLIEFKQTGRHEPFEQIVQRYGGMVYSTCFGITRNRHDAEDATQAVFLTLASQGNTAREIKYLGPWLQQVARRLSLDLRRSRKRRSRREQVHHELRQSRHDLIEGLGGLDLEELKAVVSEELGKLPLKYRLPLILHYFGGMSREEMARELGCKPNTLGVRIHRGKQMLGVRLTRRGVTMASALLPWALTEAVRSAVTQNLVDATAHAAVQYAVFGGASTALVPGNVLALAHGAPQTMLLAKFKFLAIALTVAGTIMAASAAAVAKLAPIQQVIPADLDIGNVVRPLMKLLTPIQFSDASSERAAPADRPADPQRHPPPLPGRGQVAAVPLTPAAPAAPGPMPRATLDPLLPRPSGAAQVASPAQQPAGESEPAPMAVRFADAAAKPLPQPLATDELSPIYTPPRRSGGAAPSGVPPRNEARSPERDPLADLPPVFTPEAPQVEFDYATLAIDPRQKSKRAGAGTTGADLPVAVVADAEEPVVRLLSSSPGPSALSTADTYSWEADVDPTASFQTERGVDSLDGQPFTTYYLSTGQISSEVEWVGQRGAGVFHHTGGTNVTESLVLGGGRRGAGTYALTGGRLQLASGGDRHDQLHGIEIGRSGHGLLRMGNARRSGTIDEIDGTRASMIIRSRPSGRGALHGWGTVGLTGTLMNNGRVIADGFGKDRALDLSSFAWVGNSIENQSDGGNGWFARNGGKLVLPPIPIQTGDGTYTWGESPQDNQIDLINSVRFITRGVDREGQVAVSLVASDHAEVPALPAGHTFIGLWAFEFEAAAPQSLELSIRYDTRLAQRLEIDELHLKLWAYDDATGWQRISTKVDPQNNLIFGTAVDGRMFGVSAPEPGAVGMMLIGAATLLLRRRSGR